MRKFIAILLLTLTLTVPVNAASTEYNIETCGLRYTLYEFQGDRNTYRETIRVNNVTAEKVFYIYTMYGSCKMRSTVVKCWDIEWATGEFNNIRAQNKLAVEANKLVEIIDNGG